MKKKIFAICILFAISVAAVAHAAQTAYIYNIHTKRATSPWCVVPGNAQNSQAQNKPKYITALPKDRFIVQITDGIPPVITSVKFNLRDIYTGDLVNGKPQINACISELDSGLATWNIQLLAAPHRDLVFSRTGNANGVTGNALSVTANISALLSNGEYIVKVEAEDLSGNKGLIYYSPSFNVQTAISIKNLLNGPNPFNPNKEVTQVQYQLSEDCNVDIYIYAINGKQLIHIHADPGSTGGQSGFNSIPWDGKDRFGDVAANGPYVGYIIASNSKGRTSAKIKIMVLK